MLNISEKIISVNAATSQDLGYIKKCTSENDFIPYFASCEINLKHCWIFKYENTYVGIVVIQPKNILGISAAQVSVYIQQRYRLLSTLCILSTIKHVISNIKDITKIEFLVYENNQPCLKLFEQIGLLPDYIFPDVREYDGRNLSLYNFSICIPQDISFLRDKLKDLFTSC